MSLTELTGLPETPQCLHCYLGPLIDAWQRSHPTKSAGEQIGELAQILGEVIGSGAFNGGHVDCIDLFIDAALRRAQETAYDLIARLRRGRS